MFLSEDKVFLLLALGSQKIVTFGSKRSDQIRWLSPTHLWQVEDSTLVLIYPAEVSKQKAAIQHHMLRCRHARGFRRGRRKWQDMTAICGGDCGWGAGDTTKLCGNKAPLICLLPSLRKSRFRGITQFRDRSKSVGTHTHYSSSLCFVLWRPSPDLPSCNNDKNACDIELTFKEEKRRQLCLRDSHFPLWASDPGHLKVQWTDGLGLVTIGGGETSRDGLCSGLPQEDGHCGGEEVVP